MTFGTDSVLACRVVKLLALKSPVRIVTVGTLHQTLFRLMVKGHGKLGLDVGVALKT